MINKAIVVRPSSAPGKLNGVPIPAFEVLLAGDFPQYQQELTFHIKDTAGWNQHQAPITQLFSVKGDWAPLATDRHHFQLAAPQPTGDCQKPNDLKTPVVAFAFKPAAGAGDFLYFPLPTPVDVHKSGPDDKTGFFEGEVWELEIHGDGGNLTSPMFRVLLNAHVVPSRFSDPLFATYDWHAGNDVKFYNDACALADGSGSYFADVIAAISAAQKFIFIVDWSFHPSVMLSDGAYTTANTLGALLINKAQAGVVVAILTWKHGFKPADEPNDEIGQVLAAIANDANLDIAAASQILWRADYRTLACSHHQKFVVVDDGQGRAELKVFYGGLDLTKGRYDWPEHKVMADGTTQHFWSSMTCGEKSYDEWYNAEWSDYGMTITLPTGTNDHQLNQKLANMPPRQPWHDVHAQLTGPISWDFAREFVTRWKKVDSSNLSNGMTDDASIKTVTDLFETLFDRDQFVQQWEQKPPSNRPWAGQLLHSMAKEHWPDPWQNSAWSPSRMEGNWATPAAFERSIQDSYLRAIQRAERFIYMENQYFIGSGKNWPAARLSVANAIPEALVSRINWMITNRPNDDFHVFILIPMAPEGETVPGITNAYPGVRALEWRTMGYMIREVRNAIRHSGSQKTWEDYLSFDCLVHSDAAGEISPPPKISHTWSMSSTLQTTRMDLVRTNKRYMVYIHCKLMIIDDRYLILGSANANERSMAGDRDTEICVALWPANNRVEKTCEAEIADLRKRLLTEHMGVTAANLAKPESSAFYRDEFQAIAKANFRSLLTVQSPAPPMQGHLVALPIDVASDGDTRVAPLWFTNVEKTDTRNQFLFDSLRNHDQWQWRCDLNSLLGESAMSTVIE